MKIIIVFILIVLILSLCYKLFQGKQKEHFSFTIGPKTASILNNKLNSVIKQTDEPDKDTNEQPKKRVKRHIKKPIKKEEAAKKIDKKDQDLNVVEPEPEPEPEPAEDEVEMNVIRNRNKMIKKSLKNIDNKLASVPYYKRDFDPNTRLEKTKRPNGYEFVNKDTVEPVVRLKSEIKSGYTHIKPGKNLFNSYGYSYMPPEVWSVPQDRPPVCIPQKGFEAEALPIYTKGTPLDALEIQQTLMPKFKYEEVYDPKYYYPGWKTK
jgi:hypothetical protein